MQSIESCHGMTFLNIFSILLSLIGLVLSFFLILTHCGAKETKARALVQGQEY